MGRDLLDSKREAILRELLQRVRRRNELRVTVAADLDDARSALDDARIEIGGAQIDAALLAQPPDAAVELRPGSLVGLSMPRLQPTLKPFRPHYGAAATAASLDVAGLRFAALLPALVALAEEEEAVRNLQAGLLKTVRRLKALERVVIPQLERDIRDVSATLEEEERDASARRKAWLAASYGHRP
jgi:V/A-type H+-transporting ATPase subunit D